MLMHVLLVEMSIQIGHDGGPLELDLSPAETPEEERTLVVHRLLAECVLLVQVRDLEFAFRVYWNCRNTYVNDR